MPVLPGGGGIPGVAQITQSLVNPLPQGGSMTLREMAAMIVRWLREDSEDPILYDAINAASASLWGSAMQAQMSKFVGGPVSLTYNQGDERTLAVTIADPTVPIAPGAPLAAGALPARNYFVGYTYMAEQGGETNMLASPNPFAIPANQLATIPAPAFVPNAFGWHLYVGDDGGRMCRQNSAPLPFNAQMGTPFTLNEPLGGFQDQPDLPVPPVENSTADFISYVRHMEIQLPDLTWNRWEQYDIASEMMRRFTGTLASQSPAQNYAYDVLNNNKIELRPAAGTNLSPRMFFVVRPGRLRFPNSRIFFRETAAQTYVLFRAIALLRLSMDEYTASEMWGREAAAEEQKYVLSLRAESRNRQTRVTPYLV